jgi:nicotinate-nucleotide adenylyltransferase
MKKPIGILGGTFDPIHLGHIHLATQVMQKFNLAKIKFIPCFQSPTRDLPEASACDRAMMIKLAIKPYSQFALDEREIKLAQKSYTIKTLKSLSQEYPDTPLALIMGTDAFSLLPTWHAWQKIIELTHIIVVQRPNTTSIPHILPSHHSANTQLLYTHLAGYVFTVDIAALPISSSAIRTLLQHNKNIQNLVPQIVNNYIREHNLYTAHT